MAGTKEREEKDIWIQGLFKYLYRPCVDVPGRGDEGDKGRVGVARGEVASSPSVVTDAELSRRLSRDFLRYSFSFLNFSK